jgi:hypothetical protein
LTINEIATIIILLFKKEDKLNMFKKSTIIVVALGAITLAGCGSTSTSSNATEETSIESVANIEVANEETSEAKETSEVEETLEPEYEEYDSFYENKNFVWSGTLILDYQSLNPQDYQVQFEDVDGWPIYGIYDSINLYEANGEVNGYTKPNIIVQLCATSEDGWGVVNIGDYTKYIRMEEFEGNSVLVTETDIDGHYVIPERESEDETSTSNEEVISSETTSTSNNTTSKETSSKETNTLNEASSNVSNTTPATNEVETQVVEVSDKYTPEEAVAAYRAIMESNGMTWDPSLPSDGASWGTGWIYLKKSSFEEQVQSALKGYAYGDGQGNPTTRYYFEVTGSDDNKVNVTVWGSR